MPASTTIIAQLNAKAEPMVRGDWFEDPLQAFMEKHSLGEVAGGGTQLGPTHEVAYCEIEIQLREATDDSIKRIVAELEKLGAPKGSKLILADGKEFPFGSDEGLAIYLNGTELPDSVYENCSVDEIVEKFNQLLDGIGQFRSDWQGPTETALYVYGRSFKEMSERLANFIATYPLCQKSRLTQVA